MPPRRSGLGLSLALAAGAIAGLPGVKAATLARSDASPRAKEPSGKTPRTHRRKPRASSPACHHYPRFLKRQKKRRARRA